MAADARVSVLVVHYGAYEELTACLAGLARQTCPPDQVIVVDQTEPERSRPVAPPQELRVRLVRCPENLGFAAGVNRAAREAHGEYLLILNPDAVPAPELCGTLAAWLDRRPEVGAVGPLVRDPDGTIQASARRFPTVLTGLAGRSTWLTRTFPSNPLSRRDLLTGEHVRAPIVVDWVSGACMMVRRPAFGALGGMDEGFFLYWEDADFCRRLRRAGWTTMYHPGTWVVHAGARATRQAQARSIAAFHRSALRYYWKHGGWLARAFAPAAWVILWARCLVQLALARRRRTPPHVAAGVGSS